VAKPHRAPASARDERESEDTERRGESAREARPSRGGRGALRSVSGRVADPAPLEFDRLIHERLRLGIVSALAVNDTLTFTDLKSLMGTSDGNLSVHARKLEDAGYIACTKSFDGRVPRTEYRITPSGRAALERYLDHMEALIRATRER
jgi:DNA-binding MarR family transcriptional regulator